MEPNLSSPDHIAALTLRLRSRAPWIRKAAAEELAGLDFELFERPPHLAFLLAAMNAPELRDRAAESLARTLRGVTHDGLVGLGPEVRRDLRLAIRVARPQKHADFLVEATGMLLRHGDTDAIPVLGELVERSTIRQYVVEEYHRGQGTSRKIERSFQGTPEEEHEVRRVRSAAHVAYERLRLLSESPSATLLHPEIVPDDEHLLRPASISTRETSALLRPNPGFDDSAPRPD